MSMKYLGKTIDIHGGGLENKFPHHECEIAQSEAANGVQFVRCWIHNNMVTVDGQKMGKSLNNFINLKQAFTGVHEKLTRSYDPIAIRQLILNSHYRSPLDFSDASLFAAQSGYEKITRTVIEVQRKLKSAAEGEVDENVVRQLGHVREKFEEAMNDDLNTSVALSAIFELVRLANGLIEESNVTKETLDAVDDSFRKLAGDVLGIVKEGHVQVGENIHYMLSKTVNLLIEQRNDARKRKDFTAADSIRDKLDQIGIVVEDKPGETIWRTK